MTFKEILLERYRTDNNANFSLYPKGAIMLMLFFMGLISVTNSFAQTINYEPVLTPQHVVVNRTLPNNVLKPEEMMPATFSKVPTDEEIYRVHFFEEPLVPIEGSESVEENKSLVIALAAFSQRTSPDDFSAFTNFLKDYPSSRWRGALLANLGIVYRRTGYYNKAMDAWQNAWDLMKEQNDGKVKVLADKVISEILMMDCWIGRSREIDSILKEIDNRVIEGPANERIKSVQAALYIMKSRPGIAFKCGPYALNKIYSIKDSSKPFNEKLMEAQSTDKGFSLYELEKMAKDIGLNYQMAYRTPGAVVIENAVVHWKLDHYSALLKMEGGHYKCEDATAGAVYGQQFWLTSKALDSSASGYFLVPEGSLPNGWRKVSAGEGSKVFGKGVAPPDPGKHNANGDSQSGSPNGCPGSPGSGGGCGGDGGDGGGPGGGPDGQPPMAQCNVHLAAVSLHIFDAPVYYNPPVGSRISFNLNYHQRDTYQPANFGYSNMGAKWTFNWLSYIQDDPNNPLANADLYLRGGGVRTFALFDTSTKGYATELQSNYVLVRTSPTCYELQRPDGSKDIYSRPDGSTLNGRKIFLTQRIDVAGNKTTISYDVNLRVVAIADAIGQVTTFQYNNADIYKITAVTDPFGRSANFQYDNFGRLISITDMIGIVSSFQYDSGDFITQMTTPYGTTSFIKVDGPGNFRALEMDFPLGAKERVEFKEDAPGISSSESISPIGMNIRNEFLNYRNTFYWNKKAMLEAPGDYTKAIIYHWLHGSSTTNENGFISPLLESTKLPLENRVWYNYQGQLSVLAANQGMSSKPSVIGRVLDDGTSQLRKFGYNSVGHDTIVIDPSGRESRYKYGSTGINILETRQTTKGVNELLASTTYDAQHPVLVKSITDAAGQIIKYTYSAFGQFKTITNAKNETTTFFYNSNGYLDSMVEAIPGSKTSYTYDGYGRVRTVTDPQGYTIRMDYDALDRPTLATYPDNTFTQIVYDRLDAVAIRDRMGRWSHMYYDSLDRRTAVQDALGRITQFIWCTCGNLSELVDPLKNVTSFTYDVQSRMTSKIYDDGKAITYQYENTTSRLKKMTDPKGQITSNTYFIDNNLKQVDYINAVVATPSVAYSYDDKYNRLDTMIDGTGITSYSYYPVTNASNIGEGKLSAIDGPLQNDVISFTYDAVGRVISRSINGVPSSIVYDGLGRITSATNILGTFSYSYLNQTKLLSSIIFPNGTNTAFTYFNNLGDQHLKQILNKKGSSTISKLNYEYDVQGQITKWTQQLGTTSTSYYELGYDPVNELTSATQKNQSNGSLIKRYAYQYDKAGNRTSEQIDNSVISALYNSLNQMTAQQSGGGMRFKGTVNEFSSVQVKDQTSLDSAVANVDSTTNVFETFVKVIPGTNSTSIIATDYSGNNNKTTNAYNIPVGNGINSSVQVDNNGNIISETNPAVSYDWDAADRLVKITQGANITEFIYDGIGRRVAEKLNGAVIKKWLWCEMELCEERNAGGGTVTKRFFQQGDQINGAKYYFTIDHLGSVREMTDSIGNVKARYDYDPYGRRIKLAGNTDADFGFTGHYFHQTSGLFLSKYRAYDPNKGRWLSRDPLKEAELKQGTNLYSYVANDPGNKVDPLGLEMKCSPVGNAPNPPVYHCEDPAVARDCGKEFLRCGMFFLVTCAIVDKAFGHAAFIACGLAAMQICYDLQKDCEQWNKKNGH